eukprot:TRINITY_DN643_c0_g1_i2.p1 TRINITY_DN643_c0_g1~~TRINITY_DN643_c0_g1_i2.p1  ORF type:complete len:464 (+),score=149.59 TRINITY_DN643_c0_g1_i2:155-1393(+)
MQQMQQYPQMQPQQPPQQFQQPHYPTGSSNPNSSGDSQISDGGSIPVSYMSPPSLINTYVLCGTKFELPTRYAPIKLIGQGAYGSVCSARDKIADKNVAIKKITKIFANISDTKRILREIKILRHINHENIICLLDLFKPPSLLFEDLYIVFDLMDTDLHQIINSSQSLSDEHFQFFLFQILCGLKYLHMANIIHRDLKPSNVLINGDCQVKIADFGLARIMEGDPIMTEYVATRWYRAPEVILSWKEYTKTIDVWSVGCILAEMFLRKPLFQGKSYIHQITRITDIVGTPSEEEVRNFGHEDGRQFLRSLVYKPGIPFQQIFQGQNPLAIDLLQKMLVFDPSKRCTVEEALAHPYLESVREDNEEPMCEDVPQFSFDFEKVAQTKELYQELFWREIAQFHPEIPTLIPVER